MPAVRQDPTRAIEATYVFIDTEVYRKSKFDWTNALSRSLVERVGNGSLVVLTTDIVLEEVRAGIAEELAENLAALQSAAKRTSLLRRIRPKQLGYLSRPESHDVLVEELIRDAEAFFDRIGALTVPLPDDVGPAMFARYFQRKPPFGRGKKKAEFPDAANILALELWARENYATVTVASGDPDLGAACLPDTRLTYDRSLASVVSTALRMEWSDDPWTAARILELLCRPEQQLAEKLTSAFQVAPITVNLDEGKLGSLFINDVDCEELDILSRDEMDDYVRFTAELVHTISFEADAYLDDEEMHNELEWHTSGKKHLTATLELNLYPTEPPLLEINDVSYRDSDNLDFSVPLRF